MEVERERRHRTLLGARIVFNDGRSTMDCMVRNTSDHGAKLELPIASVVPEHFVLEVLDKGTRRNAEVRWQKGATIGVRLSDRTMVGESGRER